MSPLYFIPKNNGNDKRQYYRPRGAEKSKTRKGGDERDKRVYPYPPSYHVRLDCLSGNIKNAEKRKYSEA